MAILNEAKRVEIGNRINGLVSQIESAKTNIINLENQLADLRKTVSEDKVNFTAVDLAEIDATPTMTEISAKLASIAKVIL